MANEGDSQPSQADPPRKRKRWLFALDAPLLALIAGFVVLLTLLRPIPPGSGNAALPDVELVSSRVPTLSGADPLFPPNHTIDGKLTAKGSVTNADFSAASSNVGTPATNASLEAADGLAIAVPNGDFATGTLSSWTASSGVSTATDTPHGTYAKWTSSGATLVSQNAITVPTNAQAIRYDIGYLSATTYAGLDIYVLSGAGFTTSTKIKTDQCYQCNTWTTGWANLTAYRGQQIKLKFATPAGTSLAGLDNVSIRESLPGFDLSGNFTRITSGGDTYVSLPGGSTITTSAITVDAAAQYVTVDLLGSGTGPQYEFLVATGPSFATFTSLGITNAPTSWAIRRIDVSSYRGQQIKIRVKDFNGTLAADDIGLQRVEIPGWSIPGITTQRLTETGGNAYANTSGKMISAPITVPTGAQNLSLRVRASGSGGNNSAAFYVELLSGTNYATTTQLTYTSVNNTWTTLKFGVQTFAGQSVELQVRKYSLDSLDVDDAGFLDQVLPGWTQTRTSGIDTGQDANGSFAKGVVNDGGLWIRSDWVSTGTVDLSGSTQMRFYAVSYDIGYAQASQLEVDWVNDTGSSWVLQSDASDTPTGYRTRYLRVYDFMGARGYFTIKVTGGGKLYSIADNVAREQLSEPFARKVGLGIDTTTGAMAFADPDVSIPGPIPITFTRYYNAQSDRFGTLGFRWSDSYDTRLEITSAGDAGVVFGSGRAEFFTKDADGVHFSAGDPRIHSSLIKNPDATYTYTTKDNLTYAFASSGVMTSVKDLNANQLTFAYDAQARLSSVSGAGGVGVTLGYDARGHLSTLTDPSTAVYHYAYDANGDLVSVTNPENGVRTYTYDRHRLTRVTDENAKVVVDATYDDLDRIVSQTDAAAKTITLAYDAPGKGATQVTDPKGGVSSFYFDRFGRTTDALDPATNVISYLFDAIGNLDKVIDPANNAWDFAFDASGDLTNGADPLGNPVAFTYDPKHLPTTVTDARGNVTTLAYDTKGHVTSVTDPLSHITRYAYDAQGNVLTLTDAVNNLTTYTYDSAGHVLTKLDPRGKLWTWTYDPNGRKKTQVDPLGNTTRYFYDLLGRLTLVRDPLLNDTSFLYDPVGHLLRVRDPLLHDTTWSYDNRGLVATKTDRGGKLWTYGYDANRNMTSITDPANKTTTYAYDGANRLISITDPLNHATTYTYDIAGRLASKKDALNRTTAYVYDTAGRLKTTTLPNTATMGYGYDADGHLTSTTDPLGNVSASVYDAAGRMTSSTDALAKTTTYAYDAANRLLSITDPLNHATTYTYNGTDQQTSVTDALAHASTYAYDDAGRLSTITDATNRASTYGYDAAGHLTSTTDAAGKVTTYGFDADGRMTSVRLSSGATTTYAYNSRDLLTSETDPLNHTTAYGYDDLGRQTSVTDPLLHTTSYGFDAAGRMTSITDALGNAVTLGYDAADQNTTLTDARNKTWTYDYNTLGARKTAVDPLNRTTTWGYNAEGAMNARTDARGIATTYGYDAAGHETSITYPSSSVAYGYDAAGRRTSMTDPSGTTTWGYDNADRLTSVAQPNGTIGYGYDNAGRRTSMTLPSSRTATYGYDTAGRLGSMTDWGGRQTTFGYDQDGNQTSVSRANGVVSTTVYDTSGRITSITHAKAGTTLLSVTYTYDAADRRTQVVTTGDGTETYGYDELNRLTSATYPGPLNVSYTYDKAGNRLSEVRNGTTTTSTYDDAGQMITRGGVTYVYDQAGNLTQAGSDTYGWDAEGRLTSVTRSGHTATYRYDGDGVRTRTTVDAATSDLLVDRSGGLPTVVDDGSAAYLHGGGGISKVTASGATDGLTDALGSVRGLTDATGTLTGRRNYEAFGSIRSTTGPGFAFGFAGEPADATGLVDLRARSLDPVSGRFFSPDSVIPNAAGTQGYSPYVYVANNAANFTDPTGHLAVPPTPILSPGAAQLASQFGSALASVDTPTMASSVVTGEVECQATFGNAGYGARTGCVDGAAVILTRMLFNAAAVMIYYAFACSAEPGCLQVALATYDFIRANGSSGSGDEYDGDPSVGVSAPASPGVEDPSPVDDQEDGKRHVMRVQLQSGSDQNYSIPIVRMSRIRNADAIAALETLYATTSSAVEAAWFPWTKGKASYLMKIRSAQAFVSGVKICVQAVSRPTLHREVFVVQGKGEYRIDIENNMGCNLGP